MSATKAVQGRPYRARRARGRPSRIQYGFGCFVRECESILDRARRARRDATRASPTSARQCPNVHPRCSLYVRGRAPGWKLAWNKPARPLTESATKPCRGDPIAPEGRAVAHRESSTASVASCENAKAFSIAPGGRAGTPQGRPLHPPEQRPTVRPHCSLHVRAPAPGWRLAWNKPARPLTESATKPCRGDPIAPEGRAVAHLESSTASVASCENAKAFSIAPGGRAGTPQGRPLHPPDSAQTYVRVVPCEVAGPALGRF